jgi:hypothetical protein
MTGMSQTRAAQAQSSKGRGNLLTRFLASRFFWSLLFVVVIVGAMNLGTSSVSSQVSANQTQFLADAVRRSAVQCYTIEGRYPEELRHLEDDYGLLIDKKRYAVYYEYIAANILPQIQVHEIVSQ